MANNRKLLLKEAATLPENSKPQIKSAVKIVSLEKDKQKITDFINTLLHNKINHVT